METPVISWVLFNSLVIVLLGVDLFFHRKDREIKFKEAALWSFIWISLALLFNVYIYFHLGGEEALAFFTGYLIEKSLSVDNLFVFVLIFHYFHTPRTLLHRVLFWGVLGAIIMRGIFIFLGIALIQLFHWILYVFGAFLLVAGIKFFFSKQKPYSPESNVALKLLRKFIPISERYDGHKFFTKIGRKWFATPLFVVLLVVETTDVIFALDSIPVILGITVDPFIVYTSNIFAILGLRSLYFLLSNLMQYFSFLHYGLALILVFIGLKMILSGYLTIPLLMTLGIVAVILAVSILLSLLFPPRKKS